MPSSYKAAAEMITDKIVELVRQTPDVATAGEEFWTAFRMISQALAGRPAEEGMATELEMAFEHYADELARAAFLAGVRFDARTLLGEQQAGQ